MNTKFLSEAAKEGDVDKLHTLIKHDPFLLRASSLADDETSPLHIACIAGHLDFAKELLRLRPELAKESNQDGLTPLHIASSNGDIEIVREFLKLGSHLCLVKGKEKRIPLHSAVARGRTEVVRELLLACLDSITLVTARGETCFHLAVKSNRFETFEALCSHVIAFEKEDVLNMKDEQGNTVLHIAAARKQYEVIDLLMDKNLGYKGKLEVNSLNKKGLTPLDVLLSGGGDSEIEEMLTLAGAIRVEETNPSLHRREVSISLRSLTQDPPPERTGQDPQRGRSKSASQRLQDYFKYDKIKETPSKARNTLLVIAVLMVTATYQAVLSPPGGVWQDDFWPDNAKNSTSSGGSAAKQPPRHTAGQTVMGTHNMVSYGLFLLFNSVGFFMSLHMMNFLTHGLPLQFELRVALFALTATYDTCMVGIAPSGYVSYFFIVLSIVMPFVMPILTIVVRDYKKGRRCESSMSTSSTVMSA